MDPDETLRRIRAIVQKTLYSDEESTLEELGELTELVEALDGWVSKGGFLPAAWAKGRAKLQFAEPEGDGTFHKKARARLLCADTEAECPAPVCPPLKHAPWWNLPKTENVCARLWLAQAQHRSWDYKAVDWQGNALCYMYAEDQGHSGCVDRTGTAVAFISKSGQRVSLSRPINLIVGGTFFFAGLQ